MSIVLRVTLPVEVEYRFVPREPDVGIFRDDIEVDRVEVGGIDVTERGPEAQYPGCAESIDLIRVRVGDQDITRRLTDEDMASIEDAVWQELEALSD